MNWEMLAALGQLAAVLVGIPSLIYLAVQIREQTKERRHTAVHALTVQWGDLTTALHDSAEFSAIFLRGVDPRQARPWNHPAVRVEQRDYQLHVHQGRRDSHYGFVRRGDTVEMLSKQAVFHSLHAGGAAFFTLTFPEPDRPRSRRLADNGIVELSSAAGYYWMRAYLFVDEHPYYTQTDTDGRFTLESVPPGDYEVVCWLPNWHEERHERDPESCLIIRMEFQKAAELIQKVTIRNNAVRELSFNISASDSRR